jgi:hypothetical protein
MLRCPLCDLVNPPDSELCDCGFALLEGGNAAEILGTRRELHAARCGRGMRLVAVGILLPWIAVTFLPALSARCFFLFLIAGIVGCLVAAAVGIARVLRAAISLRALHRAEARLARDAFPRAVARERRV